MSTEAKLAQKRAIIAGVHRQRARARLELQRQPRLFETTIRLVLLFCGALSIFTTVGIVLVLGNESLLFFTPPAWIDSFTKLDEEIDQLDTELIVSRVDTFHEGSLIRIFSEEMRVTALSVDSNTLTVERGYNQTVVESHNREAEIFIADDISIWEFLTNPRWQPELGEFGIWSLLNATLLTSAIAMVVALPLGLSAAIYLSEYASERLRGILKPLLELLAGVPTVVYGYFALTFMTPLLRGVLGVNVVDIYNTASAGIVVGIVIIPTIASISEDAMRAVPNALREASYGMGATRLETIIKVILPAALSGIVAAFILGISRAVGETMIVALAAGAGSRDAFFINPFISAETMTGHIARISGGDISYNSIQYNSLFAIGLMLFIITLLLNIISRMVTARFREVYE